MGWLTGWLYRKSITLSRSSGAVTDFQMRLGIAQAAVFSATGGNITTVSGKKIHTFLLADSGEDFTPSASRNVACLVVGGGGGGGSLHATYGGSGGGGAGGLIYNSAFAVTAQAYTITVGDGGAATTAGSNSVFATNTASGGGDGGDYSGGNGGNGGCGGGGAGKTTTPAGTGGTGSQGSNGGAGFISSSTPAGGGGGGYSAAGAAGGSGGGGNGGAGYGSIIGGTWKYYAGGGGGARWNLSGTNGTGGAGGGGAGLDTGTGVDGTDDTGGGGGAGRTGGAGGSGIVVISYPDQAVGCGGLCKTDFSDIRFTKDDGETLLPYWIEQVFDSDPYQVADTWVKFDSIGTSATTFYMYFGKADATAASSGDDTFPFFDDFNDASINTTKWTDDGDTSEASGVITCASTGDTQKGLFGKTAFAANYALRARCKPSHWNTTSYEEFVAFANSDQTKYAGCYFCHTSSSFNALYVNKGTGDSTDVIENVRTGEFQVVSIERNSTTSCIYKLDESNTNTITSNIPSESLYPILRVKKSGAQLICDWILVKKYLATEPTWGTWGSLQELLTVSLSAVALEVQAYAIEMQPEEPAEIPLGAAAGLEITSFPLVMTHAFLTSLGYAEIEVSAFPFVQERYTTFPLGSAPGLEVGVFAPFFKTLPTFFMEGGSGSTAIQPTAAFTAEAPSYTISAGRQPTCTVEIKKE